MNYADLALNLRRQAMLECREPLFLVANTAECLAGFYSILGRRLAGMEITFDPSAGEPRVSETRP